MHLQESYSFQSGQKIDKIHTHEKFYPGLPDRFICFQPFSKPAKCYSNWDEVLDLLFPILQKNNIQLVQVGGKDEKPLKYCIQTQGRTSWGQLEYIVSKSLLVLSTDSVSAHLAGHYSLPSVTLISNNYSDCVKPYFGDKSKQIILEPDRNKLKPIFAIDEPYPKQIDQIKPEEIVKGICKLLKLDFNYEFSTISIGQLYPNKILESAVTDVVDVKRLGAQNLIMRYDINANLNILHKQLELNPCQIITDVEIPIQSLLERRPNVIGIIYKVTENHNPLFIKSLIDNKIPYQLISNLSEEKLNPIKLSYMDYNVIVRIKNEIPDKLKDKKLSDIHFKSGKLLLGRGKFYSGLYEYMNENPILNPTKVFPHQINSNNVEILWKESEHMIFLEKNIDKTS